MTCMFTAEISWEVADRDAVEIHSLFSTICGKEDK